MQYTKDDLDLLCLVCWLEARGEGPLGMRAVAHVICNRVGYPGFSSTLNGVITGRNQFSSISVPTDPEYGLKPQPGDVQYAWLLQTCPQILSGEDADLTLGAHYYANEATMTSGWYRRVIVDSGQHPVTAVIGKQTFRS